MVLFVAKCVEDGRASATVKSYASAIKTVLRTEGIFIDSHLYKLKFLAKACRITNDQVKTRLPIKKGLLGIILDKLKFIFNSQPYLEKLYKAIFVLAYYGLMRIGELTTGNHPIKVVDVHKGKNKEKIQVVLQTSKTHSRADLPQVIKVESMCSKGWHRRTMLADDLTHCPYKILDSYMDSRPCYNKIDEPFFIFSDRFPVQPSHV